MEPVLVVGATGQLGLATAKRLRSQGQKVRALIRRPEAAARFHELGVETALGDLTQPATLAAACHGVAVVVATANAAIPTARGDSFAAVDLQGYRNLMAVARDSGVRRMVYTSVLRSRYEETAPFFRAKRTIERELQASGMEVVIFQADAFMDVTFAMIGSDLPVRGVEGATVLRDFSFSRSHLERTRRSMQERRIAQIPGDGRARHAFICVEDVAAFLVAAARGGATGVFQLSGPEALSLRDVIQIYEKIFGHPIRVKTMPAALFRALSYLMRPFSGPAANLMHLNFLAAVEESQPAPETVRAFGVTLTTAEQFLRSKAALGAHA